MIESNYLATTPLNKAYRVTAGNGEHTPKIGTVDGNRTRRSLIDSEISTPVELYGIKLAGVVRFELTMTISKTVALGQLGDTPTKLVPRDRIELPSPDYKTGVLPFN